MMFTTTIVNAHALSHLFEDDFNSIEHCTTCDEFTLHSNDDDFTSPEHLFNEDVKELHVYLVNKLIINVELTFIDSKPAGKYYNKPPPLI